jgi:hypothetical protein
MEMIAAPFELAAIGLRSFHPLQIINATNMTWFEVVVLLKPMSCVGSCVAYTMPCM